MTYLLDTNILIYLIKNQPPTVAERVNSLSPEERLTLSYSSVMPSCSWVPSAAADVRA